MMKVVNDWEDVTRATAELTSVSEAASSADVALDHGKLITVVAAVTNNNRHALVKYQDGRISHLVGIDQHASVNDSNTFGLTRARAIARRCRWPPLSDAPRGPTSESKPCGRESIKSQFARRAASLISERVVLGRP
jgi:hypothetical protein